MVDTSLSFGPPYGTTIISNQSGANYQWIDCSNFTNISGANDSSYTALTNGSYAVIISLDSCVVTSNCVDISTIDIHELSKKINVYPNPNKGSFYLNLDHNTIHKTIIYDISGKVINEILGNNLSSMKINIGSKPGIYIMDIRGNNNFQNKVKIIKY